MRPFLIVFLVCGIAACGADGEPVQPTRNATLSLTPSGVAGAVQLGLHQGPLAVSVGLGL